jgi:hypothetical protein
MPLVSLTLAIFLRAEFGFLGVIVDTLMQTPFFCGCPCKAGVLLFLGLSSLPYLTSWFMVGKIQHPHLSVLYPGKGLKFHKGSKKRTPTQPRP